MDVSSFLLQTLAVSSLSITLTRATVTNWLRNDAKCVRKLFSCPYCISHWLALSIAYQSKLPKITESPRLDFTCYWFALVAASALIMGTIQRLFLMQEAKIAELESELDEATAMLRETVGRS